MVAFGFVAFLWISRIFSAYYFVEKFDFDLRRNEFLIFLVRKKKETMKPKPEKSKEKQKNQSQPWQNPVKIQRKPKKNKFCNEMQHKATQEDFPCVPKATKQWNQNLSKSKEKQKTKANHEKTLRKSKDPHPPTK